MGPMTGRAAGYCAGYPVPGFMNPMPGGGLWGWGRRNRFYATGLPGWQRAAYGYPALGGGVAYGAPYAAPYAPAIPREQEIELLKGQAEYFEDALEGINKRIRELESKAKEK